MTLTAIRLGDRNEEIFVDIWLAQQLSPIPELDWMIGGFSGLLTANLLARLFKALMLGPPSGYQPSDFTRKTCHSSALSVYMYPGAFQTVLESCVRQEIHHKDI